MPARTFLALVALSTSLAPGLAAQADTAEKDLKDLLKVNTAVYRPFAAASMKPLTIRESPGIVSLITREEIQASGARDLLDVLKTVPGFEFGVDNEGTVGLALRGNWAHEGKALLLLDGIELNEPLFATNQFGRRVPIEEVDHIEIIRGPGSAIYGGYAELGVINVVTRGGRQLDGLAASLTAGSLPGGTPGTRALNLAYGRPVGDGAFSASGHLEKGPRSERTYTDVNGASADLGRESGIRSASLNVGFQLGGFSYRGFVERTTEDERDHYIELLEHPVGIRFDTDAHQLQWTGALGEHGRLTAYGAWRRQEPWSLPNDPVIPSLYHRAAERSRLGLQLSEDLTPRLNLLVGLEGLQDHGSTDLSRTFDQPTQVQRTKAVFGQAIWLADMGTWTLGMRYDKTDGVGSSFAPRLAFTKAWTLSHFKLLAARAFRTPSLENVNLNPSIRPETTTTYEVEWGTTLAPGVYLTLNAYDTEIKDPIVFGNVGNGDAYYNFDRVGTRGAELGLQWRDTWGSLSASHAWYRAGRQLDSYRVPGQDGLNLGLPAHKTVLQGLFNLRRGLTLSTTLLHSTAKWSYAYDPAAGGEGLRRLDGAVEADLFLRLELGGGWSAGLGAYNLLDRATWYVQPYTGDHAPLPGPGRELAVKLGYRM